MKRKIFAFALILCLAITAIAGATLAYFTDEDVEENVFAIGGVRIDLQETFDQYSNLQPGLDVNKDVCVQNIGDNDAYVRVHIAIPSALDDGDPAFNATNNFLHFNFDSDSVVFGQWSWLPEYTTGTGYKGNGAGNFNFYTQTIDGILYNVYVVTYRSALASGEMPGTDVITKVYVDKTVDCEWDEEKECFYYIDTMGNEVYPEDFNAKGEPTLSIKIIAEGCQTATFENAYDALNTSFGVPGKYNPWSEYEEPAA